MAKKKLLHCAMKYCRSKVYAGEFHAKGWQKLGKLQWHACPKHIEDVKHTVKMLGT